MRGRVLRQIIGRGGEKKDEQDFYEEKKGPAVRSVAEGGVGFLGRTKKKKRRCPTERETVRARVGGSSPYNERKEKECVASMTGEQGKKKKTSATEAGSLYIDPRMKESSPSRRGPCDV